MKPDDVSSKFLNEKRNLKIWMENDTVIIQGNKIALEYLSELIHAQANYEQDCGYQISPRGAGSKAFDSDSEVGLYIHRIPCRHKRPER